MILKVLIICLVGIACTNALIGTVLIGLDLVLSIISSGISIAHSLVPFINGHHNSKDYTSDFNRISISLEEIKYELSMVPTKTAELTNLIETTVTIARYASFIKDKSELIRTKFNNEFSNSTLKENAYELKRDVSAAVDAYKRELVGLDKMSYIIKLQHSFEQMHPCSQKSRHTHFYEMLRSYIATETLALFVTLNCLHVRQYLENRVLKVEIDSEKAEFFNRVKFTIEEFKKVMIKSPTLATRCDSIVPQNFGITYTYFRALFQKMILGPRDLSDNWFPTCPIENKRSGIKSKDCCVHNSKACFKKCDVCQRQCSNVIDCKNADFNSEICLFRNQANSERRYQLVEKYINDYEPPCPNGFIQSSVEILETNYHKKTRRQFCDCICDDNTYDKSERYISLEEMTSDTKNNRIIVGLKLRKENKILSIDIQEADLLAGAVIRNNSNKWISIKNNRTTENKTEFHKLSWFENRGIMLDFIKAPSPDYCVTGIKFSTQNIGSETVVILEVQFTQFDYELGMISHGSSEWISYNYTEVKSQTINISDRDSPNNAKNPLQKNHGKHSLVHFQPTGYFTGDAGQTSIPYIDIQEIQAESPLSGVELMLIDSIDTGGYIKIGANAIDVTPFLH